MFPTLDQAIAEFEGFGTAAAPTITGANNPGALQAGPFATSQGATGSSGGFAVFPDIATGQAAEDALVQRFANEGATLQQMIQAWAPGNAPGNTPESTQNYVNYVANAAGVNPNTPVSQLQSGAPTQSNAPFKPGWSFGCSGTTAAQCQGIDCSNPFTRLFSCCCTVLGGNVTKNETTGCAWYDILCKINPNPSGGGAPSLLGRAIAIILGLMLIAGGLFMLGVQAPTIVVGRE